MNQLSMDFEAMKIVVPVHKKYKICSCGAGMQSTALALKSCENKKALDEGKTPPFPEIPVYDLVVFCDLQKEPVHVYQQVAFIEKACDGVGINFVVLKEGDGYGKSLYDDYMEHFGIKSVRSIPFWTLEEIKQEDGSILEKKGKMPRNCTLDYKIHIIQKFVKYELLGYKKYQRMRQEDLNAHEMHIGFSYEERQRCKENPHPMFVNKFPLVDLKLERKHNYAYCLDQWGLKTQASACLICPFHTNHFFRSLKNEKPDEYNLVVQFDEMLEERQPMSKIKSKLFLSKSRKRIAELRADECNDQEFFEYRGQLVGNGF